MQYEYFRPIYALTSMWHENQENVILWDSSKNNELGMKTCNNIFLSKAEYLWASKGVNETQVLFP